MLRSGSTVNWGACGNCVYKSSQRKRNSNACEHTKWNSTLVSPLWKPAWIHGHVNSCLIYYANYETSLTGSVSHKYLIKGTFVTCV